MKRMNSTQRRDPQERITSLSEDELKCSILIEFNPNDGVHSFRLETSPRIVAGKFHYLIENEFNEQSVARRRVRLVATTEK